MEIDVKLLIKRIEESIARAGMSKTEFYKRSGISSASFSQWRNGIHKPELKKIFSAAETLDVEPDYLLGRIDEPKPASKVENGKPVIYTSKLTPEERKVYKEWDEEETYKAAKRIVERFDMEKEKSPAPDGVGLTETQQKAWDLIQGMDEESLKKFIVIAQTVKGDL